MSCPTRTGKCKTRTSTTNSPSGIDSRKTGCKKKDYLKNKASKKGRPDDILAEQISAKIIELLEKGVVPWKKPWVGAMVPTSLSTKYKNGEYHQYQGGNAFLLNFIAMAKGYKSNYWVTYNRAKQLGGYVKKGEKGTTIIMMVKKAVPTDVVDDDGNPVMRFYTFPRAITVFNVDQCENVPIPEKDLLNVAEIVEKAENIFANMPNPPRFEEGGSQAYYSPSEDCVRIPPRESFISTGEYYNAKAHEIIHSTGHPSRLNRIGVAQPHRYGDEVYSQEELVAQLGASMFLNMLGLETPETIENSAAYIAGWLKVLKDDRGMVLKAAKEAQKAIDYITNRLSKYEDEAEEVELAEAELVPA